MALSKCASRAPLSRDHTAQNAEHFSRLFGNNSTETPDATQAAGIFGYVVDQELRVIEVMRSGCAS